MEQLADKRLKLVFHDRKKQFFHELNHAEVAMHVVESEIKKI